MNLPPKEEVIAAIQELAARLGCTPTLTRIKSETKLSHHQLYRLFGSYEMAMRECGLEPPQKITITPMDQLFRAWAGVVRLLGRIPTSYEYEYHARRSPRLLGRRFMLWSNVPRAMKAYGEQAGLWPEWPDVLQVLNAAEEARWPSQTINDFCPPIDTAPPPEGKWVLPAAPMYGPPVVSPALANAPTNELGVVIPVRYAGRRAWLHGAARAARIPGLRSHAARGRRALAAPAD